MEMDKPIPSKSVKKRKGRARMPTAEVVPIATARDKKGQPPAGFCPYPAFKDLSREEGDDLFRDLSGQNQEEEK